MRRRSKRPKGARDGIGPSRTAGMAPAAGSCRRVVTPCRRGFLLREPLRFAGFSPATSRPGPLFHLEVNWAGNLDRSDRLLTAPLPAGVPVHSATRLHAVPSAERHLVSISETPKGTAGTWPRPRPPRVAGNLHYSQGFTDLNPLVPRIRILGPSAAIGLHATSIAADESNGL